MKLAIIVKGICVTTSSIDAGVVVSKVSLLFSMLPPSSYRFTDVFLDAIASHSTYPCQSVSEWVSDSFRFSTELVSLLSFTKDFTFRTSGPIMLSVSPAELMILSLIGSWLLDLIKNTNIHTTSEYSQLGSTHACIHQRSARVLDPGNSREN